MGFLKALAGAVREGASTGLRLAAVERELIESFDRRIDVGDARQRLAKLVDYLPAETPKRDVADCYLAVEARLGLVTGAAARAALGTARRWYADGEVSVQMLRELCRAMVGRLLRARG